jgi:alpha-glucosidase (family GH31 glycosyl hydrolase)
MTRFVSIGLALLFALGVLGFGSAPVAAQPAAEAVTPGNYVRHAVDGPAVVVEGERATARVTVYRPGVVRVDWTRPGAAPDTSYSVVAEPLRSLRPQVADADSTLYVRTPQMTVAVHKTPLRLRFADGSGRTLLAEADSNAVFPAASPGAPGDTTRTVQFHVDAGTRFYGTGERKTFGLRGEAFDLYNTAIFNYNEAKMTMKVNVPFTTTTAGYGLFVDSHHPGRFDVGASDADRMSYTADGGTMTYYVLAGSIPQQIEHYTALTGRQPMPPKWSLGYLQSKYGYRNEAAARGVVDTLRAKDFPVDGLVLDLYWFEHMGDLEWDRERFPEPFRMMGDLKERGVQTVAISEPYIVEPSTLYQPAIDSGFVAQTPAGEPYRFADWWSCEDCDAVLLDLTEPAARDWWWAKYPPFMGEEMAGLWTDLGEPEKHPPQLQHHLGDAREIHNLYNFLWAQTIYDGWRDARPNQRIFNLTRSGFAGIQRYGTTLWSGDVGRSWGGFQAQTTLLLNVGLAGIGLYGSDLGGFSTGTTTPELYARWMQHGALSPTMRPHGVDLQQPTEPWRYGDTAERVSRASAHLRYRLMPYLYTLAWQNHRTGLPLVRPLFFADPGDDRLHDVTSAYLLGESLLVAPVTTEGARTKDVVLPEGTWTAWGTDQPRTETYEGGQTVTVDAPIDRIPVFVKAGSIVPMRPVAPHTGAQPADTLAMRVYPDASESASFSLYEDDGRTLAYRDGTYSLTSLRQTWETAGEDGTQNLVLTAGAATGTYDGQPDARTLQAAVHRLSGAPEQVTANGQALPRRDTRAAVRQQNGWTVDAETGVLHVQIRGATRAEQRIVVEGAALR